ncbi:hypothetical protein AB0P17_30030 [Streptomyces sp. NPDC088124]|uniref:hypothetical protein n=1 Tax=Streptomyces sp. NPDC088124 TaxID=3154654 RepID=UPI00341F18B8
MTAAMADETFWGVVALSISFTALVFGLLYAAGGRPGAEDGASSPPFAETEETYSYTCHCHRDPVHITIRARQIPRLLGRGRWLL